MTQENYDPNVIKEIGRVNYANTVDSIIDYGRSLKESIRIKGGVRGQIIIVTAQDMKYYNFERNVLSGLNDGSNRDPLIDVVPVNAYEDDIRLFESVASIAYNRFTFGRDSRMIVERRSGEFRHVAVDLGKMEAVPITLIVDSNFSHPVYRPYNPFLNDESKLILNTLFKNHLYNGTGVDICVMGKSYKINKINSSDKYSQWQKICLERNPGR